MTDEFSVGNKLTYVLTSWYRQNT